MLANSPYTTRSPMLILRDAILQSSTFTEEQVNFYNDRFDIPADQSVQVVISFLGSKVFSNRSKTDDLNNEFTDIADVNCKEMYDVTIYSASRDALFRKEELLFALASQYMQQLCEVYGVKFGPLPTSFIDTCEVEGSTRLYRYSITVSVLTWYHKESAFDYYDTFNARVITDSGLEKLFVQPTTDPDPLGGA